MRIGVGLILSEILLFDWPEKRFLENIWLKRIERSFLNEENWKKNVSKENLEPKIHFKTFSNKKSTAGNKRIIIFVRLKEWSG